MMLKGHQGQAPRCAWYGSAWAIRAEARMTCGTLILMGLMETRFPHGWPIIAGGGCCCYALGYGSGGNEAR